MGTFVIIAAKNEAHNIGSVLDDVKKYCKKIIVVDDGSDDHTEQVAKEKGAKVLRHLINMGKGAAIKTGCDYALQQGATQLVLLDADGQHEPKEIPRFLQALTDADIVFGYRKMNKKMPHIFRFGNWFINKTTSMLFGLHIKDTQCGYRALTADAYRKVRWAAKDYSMESEMIANAGKERLRYTQIPIQTIYAEKYKGTTVLDGMRIVMNMFWWRLTKRRAE